MPSISLVWAIVAVSAVAACGSDDSSKGGADGGAATSGAAGHAGATGQAGAGGGAPTVSTGLPSDKKLSDLTSAEATMTCDTIVRAVTSGSFSSDYCKLNAVVGAGLGGRASDADLRMLCTAAYDQCVADAKQSQTPAGQCSGAAMDAAMCTATVAELEGCTNDAIASLHDLATKLPSCDKLTQATAGAGLAALGTSPLDTTKLASCNTLNQKCPGVTGAIPMQ